jgi:hypothetical protein
LSVLHNLQVFRANIKEKSEADLRVGKKCGSIYIDRAFKRWLKGLIGKDNYEKLDPNNNVGRISSHYVEGQLMRQLMKRFDSSKQDFSRTFHDIKMTLPGPELKNLHIPGRVNQGEIIITRLVLT